MPRTEFSLVFVCPRQNRAFVTADFRVTDCRGVVTDAEGHRTLDARVVIERPCPHCGGIHAYPAGELPCPLGGAPQKESTDGGT